MLVGTEQPPILFYAGRSREKSLDLCPENLSTDIRLVIGILTACLAVSDQQMADATAHSLGWVEAALQLLRESESHLTIATLLGEGLPLDAAVSFPEDRRITLRCKKCRQPLASVPCASCSIERSFSLFSQAPAAKEQPDPNCSAPTSFLPGTEAKLEIMRLRVACGLSVFHPQDARLPDDPYLG